MNWGESESWVARIDVSCNNIPMLHSLSKIFSFILPYCDDWLSFALTLKHASSHLHRFLSHCWFGFAFVFIFYPEFCRILLLFSICSCAFLTLFIFLNILSQTCDVIFSESASLPVSNLPQWRCSHQHDGERTHPLYRPTSLWLGGPAGFSAIWPHDPLCPAVSSTAAACRGNHTPNNHQVLRVQVWDEGMCMTEQETEVHDLCVFMCHPIVAAVR